MNVYKKIGTKERLIEMFEKVNKIKINESAMWGEKVNNENFDSPIKKDKKYLDKTVGDQTSQVSKYDDGTRYPVEDELKVKDPSLEKLKGDDAPIEESNGFGNAEEPHELQNHFHTSLASQTSKEEYNAAKEYFAQEHPNEKWDDMSNDEIDVLQIIQKGGYDRSGVVNYQIDKGKIRDAVNNLILNLMTI